MSNLIDINEEILQYAKELKFGELHFKIHAATGLVAIIAINDTRFGPALGGCRCREYSSITEAIKDALRLAQGMTYKAAILGLPLGGGKSVLFKPSVIENRTAYFEAFGQFIEDLNGRYITAVDSGTSPKDMDAIAKKTNFVTSTSEGGDPSPHTAYGVFLSIKAALRTKYNHENLSGLKVAIQGVGNVGYILAKHLYHAGAKLIITDTQEDSLVKCASDFNAEVVDLEEIYKVDADIFSPCALGAILNDETIPMINAPIVVGSANNQLAEPRHGQLLHEKGILYGPDYVVNAGGLVHACSQFYNTPPEVVREQIQNIYHTTLAIFDRSQTENTAPQTIADTMASEQLNTKVAQ